MARREDKYRPYRVDYFDIGEMRETDQALVRSIVVRAVTSVQATNLVLWENGDFHDGRIVIRAYRFYKKLIHKKTFSKL